MMAKRRFSLDMFSLFTLVQPLRFVDSFGDCLLDFGAGGNLLQYSLPIVDRFLVILRLERGAAGEL